MDQDQGDDFAAALLDRVRAARAALAAAVEATDSTAMPAALDELESALLVAREHGVDVPADTAGPSGRDRS